MKPPPLYIMGMGLMCMSFGITGTFPDAPNGLSHWLSGLLMGFAIWAMNAGRRA